MKKSTILYIIAVIVILAGAISIAACMMASPGETMDRGEYLLGGVAAVIMGAGGIGSWAVHVQGNEDYGVK